MNITNSLTILPILLAILREPSIGIEVFSASWWGEFGILTALAFSADTVSPYDGEISLMVESSLSAIRAIAKAIAIATFMSPTHV